VRVIAVDQLNMGWSERTGRVRRLADRVADLTGLVDALAIDVPIVTVAHDWGGPVSLGWAVDHVDRLAGVVLTNTAVHQPAGSPAPRLIRLVRFRPLLSLITVRTRGFLRGTLALSRRATGHGVGTEAERAYLAPYATAERRQAIGTFVADIPLRATHPSAATLDGIASGLERLRDVPTLLLWGPQDPVFSDLYLRDLRARLPHADVHRYEGASHLVIDDAPTAVDDLLRWIDGIQAPAAPLRMEATTVGGRLWAALASRSDDAGVAIVECGRNRRTTWAALANRVDGLARGLTHAGIVRGDRVALLIRPGIDLIACAYACWRIGAVIVVADSGLGVRGMRRALRGAAPRHVIGVPAGLLLARTLHLPGRRIAVRDLDRWITRGQSTALPPEPDRDADAVVAFTSGATGPAKGVVYRHDQLEAQRDAIVQHYGLSASDALVAAFAPFAVLGPALGISSAVPDMDVTAPRTLTARALADAAVAVDGSVMWASPAALTNVVATADALDTDQRRALAAMRIVMVAGAPVRPRLLREAARLMPQARITTPYGMTEALPLTEATLDDIESSASDSMSHGVLVGRPLPGVHITIDPLTAASMTGEVIVTADYVKDRYDQLWATQSRTGIGSSHRTGDVGHLDAQGRLWIEGRLGHVIHTWSGPVTPVAIEQIAESVDGVVMAACVGVGPAGAAVPVLVITTDPGVRRSRLLPQSVAGTGPEGLRRHVRELTGVEIAAVLAVGHLPVDIRHNSKLDRTRISLWAERVLAGGRMGQP
jgi:acyl-CoA synthetase (AMP-forming)/AMP-acid ligase II/pimeloyl-ACP methyl ester carboxylesterase